MFYNSNYSFHFLYSTCCKACTSVLLIDLAFSVDFAILPLREVCRNCLVNLWPTFLLPNTVHLEDPDFLVVNLVADLRHQTCLSYELGYVDSHFELLLLQTKFHYIPVHIPPFPIHKSLSYSLLCLIP